MKGVLRGKINQNKTNIILSLFIFVNHYFIDTVALHRTGLGQTSLSARASPALSLTHFASHVPGDFKGVGHFFSHPLTKSSKALMRSPAVVRQMSTNEVLAGPVPEWKCFEGNERP